jgi:RNA-directed DNA polymerase
VQEGGDAMFKLTEFQPEAVSERIKRAGELMRQWGWVELSIWTERMLTALDTGVKGGKWFSLIDKVTPERTLKIAFQKVADNQGAAGVDHVTIPMFEAHRDDELRRLSDQLRNGTYRQGQR